VRIPSPTDVLHAVQEQTEAVLQLPGLLAQLINQVRSLTETMAALERMALRAERMADELEPGLIRLAHALDNPVIDQIPDTIRQIQDNALPVIKQLRDTQARIAAIADSTTRLASIPGASLFTRRRPNGGDTGAES
jgi:ABC-type transporter Mla subunit MlaD